MKLDSIEFIEPVSINEYCWIYGEREGLTVVHEYRGSGGSLHATLIVTIPWDKVARARARRPMTSTRPKDQET
jgi:hypothetical protein